MKALELKDLPHDLKSLSLEEMRLLAEDIRQKILSTCLRNGGHLGASLGTVELAMSLHAVFDSPREAIIWDVGHQAYAHKLLTGRWQAFDTLRTSGGISGFLSREESPHDVFGAGHSSTSLSAALGIAWAKKASVKDSSGEIPWTVAVIGDGGLTAGMAFEALNNIHETEPGPFLLVLNDNQMSISENSGSMPAILSGMHAREYFGLFGFEYVGPLDGHDLALLIGTLKAIKQNNPGRPVVLHAITQKGKGYAPAEEHPVYYHGIGPVVEKIPGKTPASPSKPSFSEVAGKTACELASADPRIVCITAAMKEGTGLTEFARLYPERFFDVGIAEQHAVTFAAGLATQGFRPLVFIYSTFLQRALDQVIHDVALQKLGVTFVVDRAGIVGADGPTHHGVFDIAYLRMLPNVKVSAPVCLDDLRGQMNTAAASGEPWAIRFPRGTGLERIEAPLEDGIRVHQFPQRFDCLVIALGASFQRAEGAVRNIDPEGKCIGLISVVSAKPIPARLRQLIRTAWEEGCPGIVCVEDGVSHGGFGQELKSSTHEQFRFFEIAGYGDRFIPHGAPSALEESEGVSTHRLIKRIVHLIRSWNDG